MSDMGTVTPLRTSLQANQTRKAAAIADALHTFPDGPVYAWQAALFNGKARASAAGYAWYRQPETGRPDRPWDHASDPVWDDVVRRLRRLETYGPPAPPPADPFARLVG